MRIANLLRRSPLFAVPARAGIPPTWDRPDPPQSARPLRNKRISGDEKDYYFFQASSPTYALVNTEVAEGTILEIFPTLVKRLAVYVLTGIVVTSLGMIWAKRPSLWIATNYDQEVARHDKMKKDFDGKYGLKDLLNNPWKLNVWPENFPHTNGSKYELSYSWEAKNKDFQIIRQINKEGLTYLNNLRSQAEESLKHGGHH